MTPTARQQILRMAYRAAEERNAGSVQRGQRSLFTRYSQALAPEHRELFLRTFYALVQLPEPTAADLQRLDSLEPARKRAYSAIFGAVKI